MSESERVVELLNAASVVSETSDKLEALKIVQELLVHKEPTLLDNFLDEVMGFQKDRAQDVRKFVVGFIEEACKRDPEMLPKVCSACNPGGCQWAQKVKPSKLQSRPKSRPLGWSDRKVY